MQSFIDKLVPGAKKGYTDHNILPSLTIAQAILESNWGKSKLSVQGNNLFGIKADSRWNGKKVKFETKECLNGIWKTVYAYFRAYPSLDDSIQDHSKFLLTKRYEKVRAAKDYKEACIEIWKAGYATDPEYPKKLISIIEKYKLYEYDKEGDDVVNRQKILDTALILQKNKVKYRLGAKAVPPKIPKLLDCSGFVRYCYLAAGQDVPDGTYYQFNGSNPIKQSDLRIGDIGLKHDPGQTKGINHIGIYAGEGKWIHCNFSDNGITLEKTNIFPYIRRFKGINFSSVDLNEQEDDKMATVKEKGYGEKAIENLHKNGVITSTEHIKDLDGAMPAWKAWVVLNNIYENLKEGK